MLLAISATVKRMGLSRSETESAMHLPRPSVIGSLPSTALDILYHEEILRSIPAVVLRRTAVFAALSLKEELLQVIQVPAQILRLLVATLWRIFFCC